MTHKENLIAFYMVEVENLSTILIANAVCITKDGIYLMLVETERKNTSCPNILLHAAVDCYLCHMTSLCCLDIIGLVVVESKLLHRWLSFILVE